MKAIFSSHPTFKCSITAQLTALLLSAAALASCTNNIETASAKSTETDAVNDTSLPESDPQVVANIQKNLDASGITTKVLSAVPTQMPDIYWVGTTDLPTFYSDKSGEYVIQGQVLKIGDADPIDISANLQASIAKEHLAQVNTEDMIIYPAAGETKAVVYVFTDADCGYCRKLHSEMQHINEGGVEVRYLAWPRSEQTIPKMEAIWCSEDRQAAMNAAKMGKNISAPKCESPVKAQTDLGLRLGVRGTPAIFTVSGKQIGGYLPAQQLVETAIAN